MVKSFLFSGFGAGPWDACEVVVTVLEAGPCDVCGVVAVVFGAGPWDICGVVVAVFGAGPWDVCAVVVAVFGVDGCSSVSSSFILWAICGEDVWYVFSA